MHLELFLVTLLSPLLRLSNIWQEIQELKISFERLADIVNTKKEINELEKSKILMPKINGLIDFKNINSQI